MVMEGSRVSRGNPAAGKVKVLFLTANPYERIHLALDKELREIKDALREAGCSRRLKIIHKGAVRPKDLLRYLVAYEPDVVHISAHGNEQPQQIEFVGDDGYVKPVGKEALAGLFKIMRDRTQFVFLNACFSAPLAQAVVRHIHCAVGMRHEVFDPAVISYSASFYVLLASGKSVEEAFEGAKKNTVAEQFTRDHLAPVLYSQKGADPGKLVLVSPRPTRKRTAAKAGQQDADAGSGPRPGNAGRSFDTLIQDKIQGFVGRRFVFNAIDDFIAGNNSGYFVIRALPGMGKSALMARLVSDRGYIHHFNVASQNIRSSRDFTANICAQLVSRYNLELGAVQETASEDGGFLLKCLEVASKKRGRGEKIVLAIDALDEADRQELAPAVNILYLPHTLPEGVYAVLTTRPLDEQHLHVGRQQILDLEADSEGNLRDITSYLEAFTVKASVKRMLSGWNVEEEEFLEQLRLKSQGNFMYLYYVLPAIESGRFNGGKLDELPNGLREYYQQHWRQMREGKEKDFEQVYEKIVCILGVAGEPVTVGQMAAWSGLKQGQVMAGIRLWREFLKEEPVNGEHRYRIYHASFQDFLKEQVDLASYDGMIAEYYLAMSFRN